ncbi:hypothetical protein KL950_000614 [Ogataea haglerorum]|nr:hypothetical protein KL950_000614 [Ogataea haglerorum]KAG7785836.1 hypothetical protein KL945_003615 [Ogataea haglerorum]KAG7793916.1 hypothetical protein KL910_000611 [Ogataea haglerorum]
MLAGAASAAANRAVAAEIGRRHKPPVPSVLDARRHPEPRRRAVGGPATPGDFAGRVVHRRRRLYAGVLLLLHIRVSEEETAGKHAAADRHAASQVVHHRGHRAPATEPLRAGQVRAAAARRVCGRRHWLSVLVASQGAARHRAGHWPADLRVLERSAVSERPAAADLPELHQEIVSRAESALLHVLDLGQRHVRPADPLVPLGLGLRCAQQQLAVGLAGHHCGGPSQTPVPKADPQRRGQAHPAQAAARPRPEPHHIPVAVCATLAQTHQDLLRHHGAAHALQVPAQPAQILRQRVLRHRQTHGPRR